MAAALASPARPVLNSAAQVARWRETGRPCDVMIDTGINRLGLAPAEVGGGPARRAGDRDLDEPSRLRGRGRRGERGASAAPSPRSPAGVPAQRLSLANSAGICLGPDYAFGLTRPGLALYGGVPRREAEGISARSPGSRRRSSSAAAIEAGAGSAMAAPSPPSEPCELAILNIGYADGYLRGFSSSGRARIGDALRARGRPGLDGPDRDPRRRRRRSSRKATGSSSITICPRRPPSRASANMSC